MPENGTISHTVNNQISTIEFFHPKGNSLPGKLLMELTQKIEEASLHPESRVIVIKSGGDGAFCAGASFDELLAISNLDEGKEFFMGFANVINAMRRSTKFIIARIHGKVVGGGVGIAASADFVFAHTSASVKLSELAVGLGPFVVGPAVGRKIGVGAFTSLSVDARSWYDASWALTNNLYSKVLDSLEEMDEAIAKLAGELAASNPQAMKELREIQWNGTGHWGPTLEQRAEISGRLVLSDFTREFIEEFKKK
ncbi:enoyl-CoA hydratase/isomerase family protein [Rhodohalobacter sp. SW132]|uniref:enoyl-CoA hydratase/isomerase family protein n=1 Tax=Rhodohalobacter sp. SW132 TaxID=2293433 RepID=UPI000E251E79|nr:enoyl-CoA hydratase/isomerase family protein [Rhodohalobacter sp. SW132]REL24913.1 enoyl-CoA hydratase/isomerase family protein [Rhodohalobacter sp. SW132]